MKKIIVLLVVMGNLVFGETKLDQDILEKIEILNNDHEYELARELLKGLDAGDNSTLAVMEYWVILDEKFLNQLSTYKKNKITNLNYDKAICTQSQNLAEDTMVSQIPILGLAKNSYHFIKGESFTSMGRTYDDNKKMAKLRNSSPQLFNINEAKKIIKKYDILKKSMEDLKILKSNYMRNCSIKELKKAKLLLNQIRNLKTKTKEDRTGFISYTVVSPYLATAEILICIANTELIGHNEKFLQEAAKTLAKGAYKDILLQSNEDVRDQFYQVFQYLKETAGDKELEDLKVVQTLVDSASKAKKTGADLWWE